MYHTGRPYPFSSSSRSSVLLLFVSARLTISRGSPPNGPPPNGPPGNPPPGNPPRNPSDPPRKPSGPRNPPYPPSGPRKPPRSPPHGCAKQISATSSPRNAAPATTKRRIAIMGASPQKQWRRTVPF